MKAAWIGPVAVLHDGYDVLGIYVALLLVAGTGVGVMDRPPECPTSKGALSVGSYH